jgi:hypothetical protein
MIYTIAAILVCYYAFAMSVSVYRRWAAGKLSTFNKLVFMPPLLAFIALDVAANYTLLLVFGWPPKGAYTISSRMGVYLRYETGFKQRTASILCALLSELDPTGEHC